MHLRGLQDYQSIIGNRPPLIPKDNWTDVSRRLDEFIHRCEPVHNGWKKLSSPRPMQVSRISCRVFLPIGHYLNIHYSGYNESWDEYIGTDRIRAATK